MTQLLLGTQKLDPLSTNSLKTRLQKLSDNWQDDTGKSVLYVMSRDQRVADNHALLAAQKHACKLKLPLAVIFCLYPKAGNRAREHYEFMLAGLKEVEQTLAAKNIPFIMVIGPPKERLSGVIHHFKPAVAYVDFNPLRGTQKLAANLAKLCPVIVVDTHNVVPVWVTSQKQEYAARTIRPKIHKHLAEYVLEPASLKAHPHPWNGPIIRLTTLEPKIAELICGLPTNGTKNTIKSGEKAALRVLDDFIVNKLKGYALQRNDPSINGLSGLSPYLHFGQLSSLRVVLQLLTALSNNASLQPDVDALIEEMVVRKELSDNYCFYNAKYDSLAGAADWAQSTLLKHSSDRREFIYTKEQFEHAETHDSAWNAAQKQLTKTGKMHGYMRMYWAKKILEWSESPEQAVQIAIYLNDFYSIDGGDPNGYVGILWSIAGLHDRPWGERPVYGTIRCMVYGGLKRKFDIAEYERIWT